jgi:hypothetical protein
MLLISPTLPRLGDGVGLAYFLAEIFHQQSGDRGGRKGGGSVQVGGNSGHHVRRTDKLYGHEERKKRWRGNGNRKTEKEEEKEERGVSGAGKGGGGGGGAGSTSGGAKRK